MLGVEPAPAAAPEPATTTKKMSLRTTRASQTEAPAPKKVKGVRLEDVLEELVDEEEEAEPGQLKVPLGPAPLTCPCFRAHFQATVKGPTIDAAAEEAEVRRFLADRSASPSEWIVVLFNEVFACAAVPWPALWPDLTALFRLYRDQYDRSCQQFWLPFAEHLMEVGRLLSLACFCALFALSSPKFFGTT